MRLRNFLGALPLILMLLIQQTFGITTTQPTIKSVTIERTNVLVRVLIPAGWKKVTVQSRQKAVGSAWEPRGVLRLDGTKETDTTFTLPISAKLELIRVQADAQDTLPASFYQGTNNFNGAVGADGTGVFVVPGGATDKVNLGTGSGTSRDVVESDIWNVQGDTLYFFNQYRGLQIIDLTKPSTPVVVSTLNLPAAGEQMYALNQDYVALLARNGCGWGYNANDSSVVLVDVRNKQAPKISTVLPVPGYIQESRLVGSALYVAAQAYRQVPGKTNTWEWGSTVVSFDLANPAQPVLKDTLWFSGYGNTIYATDRFLFAVLSSPANYLQSIIQVVDISAPSGAMKSVAAIRPAGQVPDKFKMNLNGDVFTSISQSWDEKRRWVTRLENFSLATPGSPALLGSLELAAGEQLHATRFDGSQVYIVTFLRVDPLWIVDLTDPVKPRITGELQVDGWSTYIQPLGSRLLTIGIDPTNGWKVAVSLFNVQDRTKPALLSKVYLGENYSWSEANNDEKAFGVFPEAGLLLVPYQGYETNGYASRVQLIDMSDKDLKLRGTIEHAFQPRRATLHADNIYSISGKELITVNAADRSKPQVTSDLELSWTVNRVYVAGSHLLELDNGENWNWTGNPTPVVRVAGIGADDQIVGLAKLPQPYPIVGSALKDGLLYIAQSQRGWVYVDPAATNKPAATNPPTFFVTVLDARKLPALSVLGQESLATDPVGYGGSLLALWPKPGLLVWVGGGGGYYPWLGVVDGGIAIRTGDAVGGKMWAPWFYGNSGRLVAFEVKDPAQPKFQSTVSLSSNNWWNYSDAFAANGLVFSSHQSSEFVEGVLPPGQKPPDPIITVDKETGIRTTNQPPIGTWMQKYYLDVVDYADAKDPLVRKPVNIPGLLKGIAYDGALLQTVAPHWAADLSTDWTEWLDASAYDGVAAHLVASLPLKDWPHPITFEGSKLWIGRTDPTSGAGRVEAWQLDNTGKFTMAGSTAVKSSPQAFGRFGSLVVLQGSSELTFFRSADLGSLNVLGIAPTDFCYYYDLRNADGQPGQGFWAPLADFGVKKFEVPNGP